MVFEIETLQTETFLVKHRVNVSSLRAALEQVRDRSAEELQRTRIEDGENVESLEYAYFKEPVTFYGARTKSDATAAPITLVEIDLAALAEEISAQLRELGDEKEVTDIRVGQMQAQSLPHSLQLIHSGELIALSEEELTLFTQHLDAGYRDAISSFCTTSHEAAGMECEG